MKNPFFMKDIYQLLKLLQEKNNDTQRIRSTFSILVEFKTN